MARRGMTRRGGGGRGRAAMFPGFVPGGVLQPFVDHPDNRESNLVDVSLYGRPRPVTGQQDLYQRQKQATVSQRYPKMSHDPRGVQYGDDYFSQDVGQAEAYPADMQHMEVYRGPTTQAVKPNENISPRQPSKDMSWEKVRKMNSYRLRTLPLDMIHVLDEGRQRRFRVAPLEGQARKIEALGELEDQDFVAKCLDPLDLRCDCCDVSFTGATKLRAMLEHIQTSQHFTEFRNRLLDDPLYAYRMNKTSVIPPVPTLPNPAIKKKPKEQVVAAAPVQIKKSTPAVAFSPASDDGLQVSKKLRKHAEIPEEYRAMADWLACYVCNITCSSYCIYESHALGKRHQKILALAPEHVQDLQWGPYLLEGKPTIDTDLGAVKLAIQNGQNVRVGGDQPQLVNQLLRRKILEFVASKRCGNP